MLMLGDPVPKFACASSVNPRFNFDTVAGRYVVVSFFGSTKVDASARLLAAFAERGERFDVTNAIFFGVSNDPEDVDHIRHQHNGRLYLFDPDLKVSRLFGVAAPLSDVGDGASGSPVAGGPVAGEAFHLKPTTFILDPALRVIARVVVGDDVDVHLKRVFAALDAQPPLASLAAGAPVLVVPHVFEPALCRRLIEYYEATGGEDSGYMHEVNGRTVGKIDYSHKRRMDCEIADADLVRSLHQRLVRRLVPAIRQAYQFEATRIERNIIACYDAEQGAHFRAHRDNTTMGTAHRRFAVTLNLNSPAYEGGEIWFPEFGPKRYKPGIGGAIVFSCSLLHEVPQVTRGRRYAYLPFLYDDAAAAIRDRNRQYLGDLSGAGGGNVKRQAVTECSAAAEPHADGVSVGDTPRTAGPAIDGRCGCGNPTGCATCLSSPTYELSIPSPRAAKSEVPTATGGASSTPP